MKSGEYFKDKEQVGNKEKRTISQLFYLEEIREKEYSYLGTMEGILENKVDRAVLDENGTCIFRAQIIDVQADEKRESNSYLITLAVGEDVELSKRRQAKNI